VIGWLWDHRWSLTGAGAGLLATAAMWVIR